MDALLDDFDCDGIYSFRGIDSNLLPEGSKMNDTSPDTGMELRDLLEDEAFRNRRLDHDPLRQSVAIDRLTRVFEETPETLLKELVSIAVEFCHADSAGVSLEQLGGDARFRWVAIAGSFERYLHGTTPRFFSPCGTCLDRGRAQLYTLRQPYYEFLGVEGEDIKDGILIPWQSENERGTIWAVSHKSSEAFDARDYDMLQSLANFVAFAVNSQSVSKHLIAEERRAAYAEKANELAHQINNPLQSLTNTLFLASKGGENSEAYLAQACAELTALSERVRGLLEYHNVAEPKKESSRPNKVGAA